MLTTQSGFKARIFLVDGMSVMANYWVHNPTGHYKSADVHVLLKEMYNIWCFNY